MWPIAGIRPGAWSTATTRLQLCHSRQELPRRAAEGERGLREEKWLWRSPTSRTWELHATKLLSFARHLQRISPSPKNAVLPSQDSLLGTQNKCRKCILSLFLSKLCKSRSFPTRFIKNNFFLTNLPIKGSGKQYTVRINPSTFSFQHRAPSPR